MKALVEVVIGLFRVVLEFFGSKPVERKEVYRDSDGDADSDDVFDDSDW